MNFNYQNIIKEKNKRIKNILNICDRKDKEIERLHSIIKEAREYILQNCEIKRFIDESFDTIGKVEGIPILEILDKVEENK